MLSFVKWLENTSSYLVFVLVIGLIFVKESEIITNLRPVFTTLGKNIEKYSDGELSVIRTEKIGFVLQEFGLVEHRTVFDNVSVPILLGKKHFTRKETEEKVMAVLKKVGLAELKNRKAYQLSGGQKQRVAIARAIVNNPSLILADEPTGSLDSKNAKNIMELLLKIHSPETSVLVVTHDRNIAAYCSELIELSDGKIVK